MLCLDSDSHVQSSLTLVDAGYAVLARTSAPPGAHKQIAGAACESGAAAPVITVQVLALVDPDLHSQCVSLVEPSPIGV